MPNRPTRRAVIQSLLVGGATAGFGEFILTPDNNIVGELFDDGFLTDQHPWPPVAAGGIFVWQETGENDWWTPIGVTDSAIVAQNGQALVAFDIDDGSRRVTLEHESLSQSSTYQIRSGIVGTTTDETYLGIDTKYDRPVEGSITGATELSSTCVVSDVFVLQSKQTIVAIDRQTGDQRWQMDVPANADIRGFDGYIVVGTTGTRFLTPETGETVFRTNWQLDRFLRGDIPVYSETDEGAVRKIPTEAVDGSGYLITDGSTVLLRDKAGEVQWRRSWNVKTARQVEFPTEDTVIIELRHESETEICYIDLETGETVDTYDASYGFEYTHDNQPRLLISDGDLRILRPASRTTVDTFRAEEPIHIIDGNGDIVLVAIEHQETVEARVYSVAAGHLRFSRLLSEQSVSALNEIEPIEDTSLMTIRGDRFHLIDTGREGERPFISDNIEYQVIVGNELLFLESTEYENPIQAKAYHTDTGKQVSLGVPIAGVDIIASDTLVGWTSDETICYTNPVEGVAWEADMSLGEASLFLAPDRIFAVTELEESNSYQIDVFDRQSGRHLRRSTEALVETLSLDNDVTVLGLGWKDQPAEFLWRDGMIELPIKGHFALEAEQDVVIVSGDGTTFGIDLSTAEVRWRQAGFVGDITTLSTAEVLVGSYVLDPKDGEALWRFGPQMQASSSQKEADPAPLVRDSEWPAWLIEPSWASEPTSSGFSRPNFDSRDDVVGGTALVRPGSPRARATAILRRAMTLRTQVSLHRSLVTAFEVSSATARDHLDADRPFAALRSAASAFKIVGTQLRIKNGIEAMMTTDPLTRWIGNHFGRARSLHRAEDALDTGNQQEALSHLLTATEATQNAGSILAVTGVGMVVALSYPLFSRLEQKRESTRLAETTKTRAKLEATTVAQGLPHGQAADAYVEALRAARADEPETARELLDTAAERAEVEQEHLDELEVIDSPVDLGKVLGADDDVDGDVPQQLLIELIATGALDSDAKHADAGESPSAATSADETDNQDDEDDEASGG